MILLDCIPNDAGWRTGENAAADRGPINRVSKGAGKAATTGRGRRKQTLNHWRAVVGVISPTRCWVMSMSDPEPVQEAKNERVAPRVVVRRCGWLSPTKGEQLQECVVWDESKSGARLAVNAPGAIPDTFYIYMSLESTSRRHCRVAWRSDKQIGVKFLD
jgi:hypothetical protein